VLGIPRIPRLGQDDGVCPGGTKACGNGDCCPKPTTCCGNDLCCPNKTGKCCGGNTCCRKNDRCCGEECCAQGQGCCNGNCIDPSRDPRNCGQCNVQCGDSQLCCGGTCVSIGVAEHCTSCAPCAGGSVCVTAGVNQWRCDCPRGQVLCSGRCVTPTNDQHCGDCNPCDTQHGELCCPEPPPLSTHRCHCGTCRTLCELGDTCCGGQCVAPGTALHCNGCAPCPAGQICDSLKRCICPDNQPFCNGKCCDACSTCNGGRCVTACRACEKCDPSTKQCDANCPPCFTCDATTGICVPYQVGCDGCDSGCNGICANGQCFPRKSCSSASDCNEYSVGKKGCWECVGGSGTSRYCVPLVAPAGWCWNPIAFTFTGSGFSDCFLSCPQAPAGRVCPPQCVSGCPTTSNCPCNGIGFCGV